MQEYPYNSAQILTDFVFLQYGGQTGTSTVAQRQAAYHLAEMQMTEHLNAFLSPTVITGSAFWRGGTLFDAEFGYITRVLKASSQFIKQYDPLDIDVVTGSAVVRNARNGLVDIFLPCSYGQLYSTTLIYESGLATGTVTHPNILAALSLAAQIHLNEWDVSLSNEGTADIGVTRFFNQSYSEERKFLKNTVFGNSAKAQRIILLTKQYRAKPMLRLR